LWCSQDVYWKKQNNMSIIYHTSHEGPFKYAFNYKYNNVLYLSQKMNLVIIGGKIWFSVSPWQHMNNMLLNGEKKYVHSMRHDMASYTAY
jgi:hypothetical protein